MRIQPTLIALVLCACGSSGVQPSPSAALAVEGSWQLTSGRTDAGDIPILDDRPITLTIEGTQLGGSAACNTYGGRAVAADGKLRIRDLGQTAMGCEEQVMASETAYLTALGLVREIAREGDELVARGIGVELRFAALPEPPTAELVDTTWVLETILVGDVAASTVGQRATLVLAADGSLSGSTGCRAFEGQWRQQGEQIVATTLTATDIGCEVGVDSQDQQVMSVIGDGFVPSIEDDLLALTDPGGIGLVYRMDQ